MRASLGLCCGAVAALATATATGASAQTVQTYRYDAQGRLAASATARTGGPGSYISYGLDAADNRASATAANTTPPPAATVLEAPNSLMPSQWISSPDGTRRLTFTPAGSLAVMNGATEQWSSCTANGRAIVARVSATGRLELLAPNLTVLWTTPNAASAGAKATVTNLGVAELRTSGGALLWSSTTPCL